MLEQIQWTDMVLIAILALSTIIGLLRGFVREFFTIFNFGIAILVAYKLPPIIVNFMKNSFNSTSLSPALLMTVLFAFTMLILTKFSRPISRKYSAGYINKTVGLVFGFTRGLLITVSIIAFGIFSLIITEKEWKGTPFINLIKPATDTFISLLPPSADKKIADKIKTFDNRPTVQAIKKLLNNNFNMKLVTNDEQKPGSGNTQDKATTPSTPAGTADQTNAVVDPNTALTPKEKKLMQMQHRLYGPTRRDMNTKDREILLNRQQKQQQLEQEKLLQQQKEQEKLKKEQAEKAGKAEWSDSGNLKQKK